MSGVSCCIIHHIPEDLPFTSQYSTVDPIQEDKPVKKNIAL